MTTNTFSFLSGQQETRSPAFEMGTDVSNVSGESDIDVDLHGTILQGVGSSSKVQSVIDHLVQLGQLEHEDSKPIKR